MIKTTVDEKDENRDIWKNANYSPDDSVTDLVTADQLLQRLNTYLQSEPLNIEKNDYCYIKVVKNHLEIGRAKIMLEE